MNAKGSSHGDPHKMRYQADGVDASKDDKSQYLKL